MKKQPWMDRQKLAAYNEIQQRLEYLIMATPTGKTREYLTEANIQLTRAMQEEESNAQVSLAVERRTRR